MNKYGLLMNVNLLYCIYLYNTHCFLLGCGPVCIPPHRRLIVPAFSLRIAENVRPDDWVMSLVDHWDFPEDTKWITRGGSCLPQGRKRLRFYDLMIDQNDGLNGRQFGRSCLGNDSKIISGQDFQTSRKLGGEGSPNSKVGAVNKDLSRLVSKCSTGLSFVKKVTFTLPKTVYL